MIRRAVILSICLAMSTTICFAKTQAEEVDSKAVEVANARIIELQKEFKALQEKKEEGLRALSRIETRMVEIGGALKEWQYSLNSMEERVNDAIKKSESK